MKGVPVRIAIGPKDLEKNTVEVARRDTLEKQPVAVDQVVNHIVNLLDEIQDNIFNRAQKFQETNTHEVNDYDSFKKAIEQGGFVSAHWDGSSETEELIKQETKATIRCIPLNNQKQEGVCVRSGKPSSQRVIFAKAY